MELALVVILVALVIGVAYKIIFKIKQDAHKEEPAAPYKLEPRPTIGANYDWPKSISEIKSGENSTDQVEIKEVEQTSQPPKAKKPATKKTPAKPKNPTSSGSPAKKPVRRRSTKKSATTPSMVK